MKKIIALIQCRLASSRLPRKALLDIEGRPLLNQLYRRLSASKLIKGVWVCCPESDVVEIQTATNLPCIGGPEKDILTRLLNAAEMVSADRFVRVGADCPLADPLMIDHMIRLAEAYDVPIVQNWKPRLFPDGLDCEVWSVTHLKAISRDLTNPDDREWFAQRALDHTPGDWKKPLTNNEDLSRYRLTVDYPEDLEVVRRIFKAMKRELWDARRIVRWLDDNPQVKKLNQSRISDFGARPVAK